MDDVKISKLDQFTFKFLLKAVF